MTTGGTETLFGAIEGRRDGSTVRFVKTYIPADEVWGDIHYEGTLNAGADDSGLFCVVYPKRPFLGTTQIYTALDFQRLAAVYDAAHPRARRRPSA